jgi:hypothetical protein
MDGLLDTPLWIHEAGEFDGRDEAASRRFLRSRECPDHASSLSKLTTFDSCLVAYFAAGTKSTDTAPVSKQILVALRMTSSCQSFFKSSDASTNRPISRDSARTSCVALVLSSIADPRPDDRNLSKSNFKFCNISPALSS